MKEIVKILESVASRNGRYGSDIFIDWLDFMIEMFNVEHYMKQGGFEDNAQKMYAENPELMQCTLLWMNEATIHIERCETWDGLGLVYEDLYKSKGKADALGQFFTPECICDLMARCSHKPSEESERINDCACGSGRTLMAIRCQEIAKRKSNNYYYGEDIDSVSVRMCALNLMIYGCRGMVTRMDTLKYVGHWDCYVLNEVRYPIPTPFYSIRKAVRVIEEAQPKKEVAQTKKEEIEKPQSVEVGKKPIQLTLF